MNKDDIKKLGETAKEAGIMAERERILREILLANLPVGVWGLIKDIINPDE